MLTRRSFALTLAAGSLARAADPATQKQRGREIIQKTVNALGGDAFRNMRTRTESGSASSFYHSQLTGLSPAHLYTKYLPADYTGPLRQMQREAFGKKQDDIVIFTASDIWEITYRGAEKFAADRFEQYRNSTMQDVFYLLRTRFEEPGLEFAATGSDVVDNRPVEVVEIYDSEDRNITVWIHSDTFLPVRQRFRRWDPVIKERRDEVANFSNYRSAGGGVMWPWRTDRERDGEKIYQFYSDHVTVGDPLADSLFELPKGIKILKS